MATSPINPAATSRNATRPPGEGDGDEGFFSGVADTAKSFWNATTGVFEEGISQEIRLRGLAAEREQALDQIEGGTGARADQDVRRRRGTMGALDVGSFVRNNVLALSLLGGGLVLVVALTRS